MLSNRATSKTGICAITLSQPSGTVNPYKPLQQSTKAKTNFVNASPEEYNNLALTTVKNPWTSVTYSVLRIFSAIMHLVAAIIALSYWIKISGGSSHSKLYSNAYFSTDVTSMLLGISNRGFITSPATSLMSSLGTSHTTPITLDTTGMVSYAQPIVLKYDNGHTFTPNRCLEIANISISNDGSNPPTDEDVAAWRACRATDIPVPLVDMAYARNTMTFFGSNNMIALIYNTLVITAAISIACFPNFGMKSVEIISVMLAECILIANLIMMLAFPFNQELLHLPPNNAIFVGMLHVITGVGIIIFSMKNRNHYKNSPIYNNKYSLASTNGMWEDLAGDKLIDAFNHGWVSDFLASMQMVNVRYFEYSMTAGLFLVSMMLALYPNANSYVYQQVYWGMMFCNLVAIPITNAITGFSKEKNTAGNDFSVTGWIIAGVILCLASSIFFFFASLTPFFMNTFSMISNPQIPKGVLASIILVLCVFFGFLVAGSLTMMAMIWGLANRNWDDQPTMKWIFWQLIIYEFLNWGKWWISMVVIFSAIAQIGLE